MVYSQRTISHSIEETSDSEEFTDNTKTEIETAVEELDGEEQMVIKSDTNNCYHLETTVISFLLRDFSNFT